MSGPQEEAKAPPADAGREQATWVQWRASLTATLGCDVKKSLVVYIFVYVDR